MVPPRVVPLVALLVRSWNLFHGNASPPRSRSHLREMIELVTRDEPDVVCLQEVPVWGLSRLVTWSGMQAFPVIARRGLRPAQLAGWVTRLHNGLLRSAVAGQANAILVRSDHACVALGSSQVSDRGAERRVCQVVRVDGATIVANTHLSSAGDRQRLELERALAFAESHADPGTVVVLAGDFNLHGVAVAGFSHPGPGIDHVLVRGVTASDLVVWPEERRRQNGLVLSDHAPVELVVG
jgi:endonuclease/exonuclease/phosphatase family metal-dependent hydrolase